MKTNKTIIDEVKERVEEVLDEQFPKGKCKERGHALVLYAQMIIDLEKALTLKEAELKGFQEGTRSAKEEIDRLEKELYKCNNSHEDYFKQGKEVGEKEAKQERSKMMTGDNFTKKRLREFDKEDLILLYLNRNDDAKDYEKCICKLERETKGLFTKKDVKAFGEFCWNSAISDIEDIISELIEKEKKCLSKDKYIEQELEHINQLEMANKISKRIKELRK